VRSVVGGYSWAASKAGRAVRKMSSQRVMMMIMMMSTRLAMRMMYCVLLAVLRCFLVLLGWSAEIKSGRVVILLLFHGWLLIADETETE
jgi:hypothetical protein